MNPQISLFLNVALYNKDSINDKFPVRKKPVSPERKVRELIDQLDKFHKLKESGDVSSAEYEELRSTILSDIKTL